ncbi:MAG TPA: DUF6569 family protein, partial [Schlesneria sp.]
MLRKLAGLMVAGVLIVGCSDSPPAPRTNTVRSDTPASEASSGSFALADFVVGEAIRYENLVIFPVSSRAAKTEDRYITLDEGMKAGTVEIRELAATYERPDNAEGSAEEAPTSALDGNNG